MELLGEEIHTQVAVLAGLRRGGDADHLARTTLEDQKISDADVVARDGNGIGIHPAMVAFAVNVFAFDFEFDGGWMWVWVWVWERVWVMMRMDVDFGFLDDDFFAVDLFVRASRVDDAVGCTLDTTADAMVLAFVVVIAHIRSSYSVDCRFPSGLFNSDLFAGARRIYGDA